MLLCQQTHKTQLNYHLVADELPFIPKVIDCTHQTIKTNLERQHSILLSVTHTLCVYQVCYDVGRCIKDGSYSSSSLEWKLIDSINGISYYLNECQTLSNTSEMTFFSVRKTVHWCACIGVQHSPTAVAVSTSFLLNHASNSPELNTSITRFRELCSTMSMSRESKRLKKSRNNWLNFDNALIQQLSEKCDFRVSPFAR